MATAFAQARAPQPFIHPDDMPERYALTGTGTCMEPIVQDGALIVADKTIEPEPDDVVIVHFTQDYARLFGAPGCVKRLRMPLPPPGFDGLMVVEQVNPLRSYSFRSSDVLAVHKVIGFAEPNGPDGATFRTNQEAPR